MDRREARREAKFRAGLILESVLANGWGSDPGVVEKYGSRGAEMVEEEVFLLARRLIEGGGRVP